MRQEEMMKAASEFEAIRADLQQLVNKYCNPAGWRSPETAPKDGTRVIMDFGRAGIHIVAWEESVCGTTIWCVDDNKHGPYALRGYLDEDIRGWLPLPISKS